jgi:hypothetical protein
MLDPGKPLVGLWNGTVTMGTVQYPNIHPVQGEVTLTLTLTLTLTSTQCRERPRLFPWPCPQPPPPFCEVWKGVGVPAVVVKAQGSAAEQPKGVCSEPRNVIMGEPWLLRDTCGWDYQVDRLSADLSFTPASRAAANSISRHQLPAPNPPSGPHPCP